MLYDSVTFSLTFFEFNCRIILGILPSGPQKRQPPKLYHFNFQHRCSCTEQLEGSWAPQRLALRCGSQLGASDWPNWISRFPDKSVFAKTKSFSIIVF